MKRILVVWFLIELSCLSHAKPKNVLFILTDDQDTQLGGLNPMEKTRKLIGEYGVTFTNAFATTPICCPSRASILTGKYMHNHGTFNNSLSGGCGSSSWQAKHEKNETFINHLKKAGYLTMYAGKYLNTYGNKAAGGVSHVPPGWDWWIGLLGNSKYYNYTLSVNGSAVHHGDEYKMDYFTDVIRDYGIEFLSQNIIKTKPFFMLLAPPASHAPFTPAPQYKGIYEGVRAPRTPNFNILKKDKHWLLRMPPAQLSTETLNILDTIYQSRLETLKSVDDLVADIINQLDLIGILNNTYVIFTSDHGFHVGQFGLPWDKRQPYEFDIKIPLLVRGPNVLRNKTETAPVLNIDFAPTIMNFANLKADHKMDGKSILPYLLKSTKSKAKSKNGKSRTFLVEYHGEGNSKSISPLCPLMGDNSLAECSVEAECKCQDSSNNTYSCIRQVSAESNSLFCEFIDTEGFLEMYNIQADPYQLKNLASKLSNASRRELHATLSKLKECRGFECSLIHIKSSNNVIQGGEYL